jgi:hypothetical protein
MKRDWQNIQLEVLKYQFHSFEEIVWINLYVPAHFY